MNKIIALSPEREAPLRQKLAEYKSRFNPRKAPELQMGTICKTRVLEVTLLLGQVDPSVLQARMSTEYGSSFDPAAFQNAVAVIRDYCETGGLEVHGGTGLNHVCPNCGQQQRVEAKFCSSCGTRL